MSTDAVDNSYVKALIYGESGAGKTTLAGTLDNKKTLIISAESGLLPLRDKKIAYISLAHNDKGEIITDPQQRLMRLAEAYASLQKDSTFENVFIDSLTEINDILMEALKQVITDPKDTLKLYGENLIRMKSIIKQFRDLPTHNVFMTCVAVADKDENNKRIMDFQLVGQIGSKLPQYFDEVFYLGVDDTGKRMLITKKTDKFTCKDRSKNLDAFEQPDLGAIMKKILTVKPEDKEKK